MVRIATLFAIVAGVLLSAAPASAQTQQARVLVFHPDPAGRPAGATTPDILLYCFFVSGAIALRVISPSPCLKSCPFFNPTV